MSPLSKSIRAFLLVAALGVALEEIETEKASSGSRETARSLGTGEPCRIVSDAVSVPQKIEAAAEAYLDAYLNAVIVSDAASASSLPASTGDPFITQTAP